MEHDINNLKIEVAVINEKLDSQGKKLDELLEVLKGHIHEINCRYDTLNVVKADKTEVDKIQNNLGKVVWVIILGVIGAVLKLILIK